MRKTKGGTVIFIALMLVFCTVFAFSAHKVYSYYSESSEEAEGFDDVLKAFEDAKKQSAQSVGGGDNVQGSDVTAVGGADTAATLAGYAVLHETNSDLFGWIRIDGTVINYPVMHTPDEPEKYIHKSFDGKTTSAGTPFLSGGCFEGCKNYIVYAHNMKSGAMFARLMKYRKESFWAENMTVSFDTLAEIGEYTVFAAFYADVGENSAFKYFLYTDLTEEERFEEYIEKVKENALYDTKITPQFGDELLTLSTCTNRGETERFVVVAVKNKE